MNWVLANAGVAGGSSMTAADHLIRLLVKQHEKAYMLMAPENPTALVRQQRDSERQRLTSVE